MPHSKSRNLTDKWIICPFESIHVKLHSAFGCVTCAAVESQSRGSVKLLDEELRQGNPVVGAQRLITAFPVQHQVLIRVSI